MPVHDWTRVSEGTFHDFHYSWVLEIKRGLLPEGYYVMAEQLGGDLGAPIPAVPFFLTRKNHVRVPLEATYQAAWEDVPPQYQRVLERPS